MGESVLFLMEFTAALSSGKFKSSFEQSVREGKKEKKRWDWIAVGDRHLGLTNN